MKNKCFNNVFFKKHIFCIVFLLFIIPFIISCAGSNSNKEINLIEVDGFRLENKLLTCEVSNSTEDLCFSDLVKTEGEGYWEIALDKSGTKIAITNIVDLNVGNNTFYLLLVSKSGKVKEVYNVQIKRKKVFNVSFDTDGGSQIDPIQAEEGDIINIDEPTKLGYTFIGWDKNIANPISDNIVYKALWQASEIKYTINYYIESLDAANYELYETEIKYGVVDSEIIVTAKNIDHFTPKAEQLTDVIRPDGSTLIEFYYNREQYSISVKFDSNFGSVYGGGVYKYGERVVLESASNPGYDFVGFYNGKVLMSQEKGFSFLAEESSIINALWIPNSQVKYTLEYYVYDLNGSGFLLDKKLIKNGTTGETVYPTNEEYEEYDWQNPDVHGIISGDGSLVLKLYFMPKSIRILYIDDSHTFIDENEFLGFGYLEEVYIPDTVTEIRDGAFRYCVNLKYVRLPQNLEKIGDFAFEGCVSLESIEIPESTISIGIYAFSKCFFMEELLLSEGLKDIGYGAFNRCVSLQNLTIPKSVKTINAYAFSDCRKLNSVVFKHDSWFFTKRNALGYTFRKKVPANAISLTNTYCNVTWTAV